MSKTKIFKKTPEQLTKVSRGWVFGGLFLVFVILFYLLHGHSVANLPNENLVQATVMSYRLKVAVGLIALGGLASYGLTWVTAHSPIGKWALHWDDVKDDSRTKAAKIVALSVIYGATLMGVFKILANVISSS